jgi:hypothetical protein
MSTLLGCGGSLEGSSTDPPNDDGGSEARPLEEASADAAHPDSAPDSGGLCCFFTDGSGKECGCNGVAPSHDILFYDEADNPFWCSTGYPSPLGKSCLFDSACSVLFNGSAKLGTCH